MHFRATILMMLLLSSVTAQGQPAGATGHLHLTFNERSPLSSIDQMYKLSPFNNYLPYKGPDRDGKLPEKPVELPPGVKYDLAAESFEAIVPANYRPKAPIGLLVFISAGDANIMPTWFDVFTRHRLIWICANNSGNGRHPVVRAGLALDAAHNMSKLYNIDPDRIFICGFSGGGLCASEVIHAFPNVFHGCLSLNGEDYYDGRKNEAGVLEPGVMEFPPWNGSYEKLKKSLRLVILTGQDDVNNEPEISRANYQGLVLDGFTRVTLLEVPRGGHNHPEASWFERGVAALDAKPKNAPTTSPTNQTNPLPAQIAQSRRLLTTAQCLIDQENAPFFMGRARECLQKILEEYPTTPSAPIARELLVWMEKNIKPKGVLRSATTQSK
jgi:hypothetical protein